jgi:hypothetical protein
MGASLLKTKLLLLCFLLLPSSPLLAREKTDVVVMRNGDRLTCEIKSLDSDVLYVKLDYVLGTISVDWWKVDHIESKQLFLVRTQDGSVYSGALATTVSSAERPVTIEVLEPSSQKVELDKSQITKIEETAEDLLQRFNGQIGLGSSYNRGNQSGQYNLNADVNYPRERWSASASYSSILSSSNGTSTSTRNEIDLSLGSAPAALEQLVLHRPHRVPAEFATRHHPSIYLWGWHWSLSEKHRSRFALCDRRFRLAAN